MYGVRIVSSTSALSIQRGTEEEQKLAWYSAWLVCADTRMTLVALIAMVYASGLPPKPARNVFVVVTWACGTSNCTFCASELSCCVHSVYHKPHTQKCIPKAEVDANTS